MNLFRIRGIQLAVHASFFLLLAYAAWEGWQPDPADATAGGWLGVFWNVTIVLAFFTCVVLHELGHSFTAMRFGVGVRRILLMPIGGMAEFDAIPRQPGRELAITLAGPAVNFVIAGGLWLFLHLPPVARLGDDTAVWRAAVQLLQQWNLVMGCFNLVPVFPMDGGRIFRAVLATRLSYLRATAIAATVGKVLAVAGIIAAVFAPEFHLLAQPAYLAACLFAFIFFAGEMEYRATRRRERDDAHWRESLARLYAGAQPVDEPPLLSS